MKNLLTLNAFRLGIMLPLALLATFAQAANDMDPLNPAELAKATSLVQSASTPAASQRTLIAPSSTATTTTTAPELLLVERHINEKDQSGRRADVYKYDYSSNETLISLIDLDTNQVISTKRQQHLQLPLTENELQRASDLIFADDEERTLLASEYKRITGQTLNGPEQLQVKAFVFLADSLPEQLNAASKQCGLHRCAQVLLYTHDSVVFEVSPIVNLSAGVITQNIGF
jgi:Cu2+-containing amine oxidase